MSKKQTIAIILLLMLAVFQFYYGYTANNKYLDMSAKFDDVVNRYNDLSLKYSAAQSALVKAQNMYGSLLSNYSKTQLIYPNGQGQPFGVWNYKQTIQPNGYGAYELLDTFINHIKIHTDQPAQFMVLGLSDFVNFVDQRPYTALYLTSGTDYNIDVHETQGCAAYVLVIVNLSNQVLTVTPNVTVTYAPTPFLTGVCGQ